MVSSSGFDTVYPADSLEFCPTPGFQDLFACGTYKLVDRAEPSNQEEQVVPQTRRGQCLVFKYEQISGKFDIPL